MVIGRHANFLLTTRTPFGFSLQVVSEHSHYTVTKSQPCFFTILKHINRAIHNLRYLGDPLHRLVNVLQYGESMFLLLGAMLNQDLHLSRTDILSTHF